MGNALKSVKKEKKIVLTGLDGAGKTSLLYQIKMGEMIVPVPTLSPNVEKIAEDMVVWDLGGHENIRSLWFNHFTNANIVVFVVDASNRTRRKEAAYFYDQLASTPLLKNTPILVLANKQDLEECLSPEQIKSYLNIKPHHENVTVLPSSASSSEGLGLALEWIQQQTQQQQQQQQQQHSSFSSQLSLGPGQLRVSQG